MKKRTITGLLCLALIVSLISGCDNTAQTKTTPVPTVSAASILESAAPAEPAGKSLSIVTTIFPEYDWVRTILGDRADDMNLTLLLDNGADLHNYQPTADDMVKIATCDLFVYVGGESDEWVEDALAGAVNKDMEVINLLDALGDAVKEEEVVEGMEADHDHEGNHKKDHDEEPEYDEHVWLSLRNSAALVETIGETLEKLDTDYADTYAANVKSYVEKLNALDKEYAAAVKAGSFDTVLFGDRFPFRYLVDDYDLDYYAAFVGCSAETEASFETVVFLADKVDELGLSTVLTLESGDGKIARTIVETTKDKTAQILSMDSLQSATMRDVEAGVTYLSVMEKNLDVLKQALQ